MAPNGLVLDMAKAMIHERGQDALILSGEGREMLFKRHAFPITPPGEIFAFLFQECPQLGDLGLGCPHDRIGRREIRPLTKMRHNG
jgi:hypothetical protein